jgi:hypothetical protein
MADPRFREQAKRFLAWRARRKPAAAPRERAEAAVSSRRMYGGSPAVFDGTAAVDVMFEVNRLGMTPTGPRGRARRR